MIGRALCSYLALAACGWIVPASFAVQSAKIDFESQPLGTTYGGEAVPPDNPGDVVIFEDGIAMSVENFFVGQFEGFNSATVGGMNAHYFPTTPLELNNINVRFDFTQVGFDVTMVTVDYMEFGGADNFAVNVEIVDQNTVYILETSLTGLPMVVAPGVTAIVDENVSITLSGDITSFVIGGQELSIDNIVAVPEPASLLLLGLGAVAVLRRDRRRAR
jgi:hypothetical protein